MIPVWAMPIVLAASDAVAAYIRRNWRWGEKTVTLESDTKETHAQIDNPPDIGPFPDSRRL